MRARRRIGSDDGQASVELLGSLPVVLLVGAILVQSALAGYAAWACANAARVAARAEAVGGDGEHAARSALPSLLSHGLSVRRAGGGLVRVRVPVPLLVPGVGSPLEVGASAQLAAPP